jgi:hypothetical protein
MLNVTKRIIDLLKTTPSHINVKKYLFCTLFILFTLLVYNCFSQAPPTKIEIVKKKKATFFVQNGKNLRFRKLARILSVNPLAYSEIKLAKKNRLASNLILWPGAILIGVYTEGLIKGYAPNAVPVGVGITLIVSSIPLKRKEIRHTLRAVELYNRGIE